jgi:hypothetical protein
LTRLASLGLGLLALLLCGIIALECTHRKLLEPKLNFAAQHLPEGPVNPGLSDAKDVGAWAAAIVARPLFEPSRRPPESAAAAGATATAFPRLAGIIITPQSREAIFAAAGSPRPIVVMVGSRLNGVLIKSIDDGVVVVTDAQGTRAIRPSFDTSSSRSADGARPTAAMPVTVDLPPTPSGQHPPPFASILGLTGRPLGLAANPDPTPSANGGAADNPTSLPAPAPTGGSP